LADLVVLPHALEFQQQSPSGAREVHAFLMPEGHVVLSGFNPWSLWGVRRLGSREGVHRGAASSSICRGSKIGWRCSASNSRAGACACYAPPVATENVSPFRLHEEWDRWWPFAANLLPARIKRVRHAHHHAEWKSAE